MVYQPGPYNPPPPRPETGITDPPLVPINVGGSKSSDLGYLRSLDRLLGDLLSRMAVQIALPLSYPFEVGWLEEGSVALTAAQATAAVIYTVPADRRVILQSVLAERASGDNTLDGMILTYPAGYGSGTRSGRLVAVSAGVVTLWWPEPLGTLVQYHQPGHLLLEPGTTLAIEPTGAGAGGSVVGYVILMRQMPYTRSSVPYQYT